jgi:hypothetical protein
LYLFAARFDFAAVSFPGDEISAIVMNASVHTSVAVNEEKNGGP